MDRNPGLPPAPDDRAFVARINNVVARKLSGQVQAHNPVWSGLGMAGLVGWSVTIPTVLGTMLGVWLDHHHPVRHSWTITLLVLGVALGCANAWHWLTQQSRLIDHQNRTVP
jgi:ATP synthase protein I